MTHCRSLRVLFDNSHGSLFLFFSASNCRKTEPLSLLPVANKQICLSLGIQRHFRLDEARAVAQEETTTARCGLSSAWEGRTKGIYDVHLSSLYLLSFLFPLPDSFSLSSISSLGQSHQYFSTLYRSSFSSIHAPFSSSVFIIAFLQFSVLLFIFLSESRRV